MLVDDNKTFLVTVKHFLQWLPEVDVVAEAHDGKAALALAAELAPDLVLLDISMPVMGGLELAPLLNAMGHPPRIMFLSMHDSEAYRTAAQELGAYGYVDKSDFVVQLLPLIDLLISEMANQPSSLAGQYHE